MYESCHLTFDDLHEIWQVR